MSVIAFDEMNPVIVLAVAIVIAAIIVVVGYGYIAGNPQALHTTSTAISTTTINQNGNYTPEFNSSRINATYQFVYRTISSSRKNITSLWVNTTITEIYRLRYIQVSNNSRLDVVLVKLYNNSNAINISKFNLSGINVSYFNLSKRLYLCNNTFGNIGCQATSGNGYSFLPTPYQALYIELHPNTFFPNSTLNSSYYRQLVIHPHVIYFKMDPCILIAEPISNRSNITMCISTQYQGLSLLFAETQPNFTNMPFEPENISIVSINSNVQSSYFSTLPYSFPKSIIKSTSSIIPTSVSTTIPTTSITPIACVGGGYFVTGTVNGVISGYGSIVGVTTTDQNSSFITNLTDRFNNLQSNGSISEYRRYSNGTFGMYLASMNAYSLQSLLSKVSSQLHVNGTEYVMLPQSVLLYYNGNPLHIELPTQNYTVATNSLSPLNSNVMLKVYALVNANGMVCNNDLSLTEV